MIERIEETVKYRQTESLRSYGLIFVINTINGEKSISEYINAIEYWMGDVPVSAVR